MDGARCSSSVFYIAMIDELDSYIIRDTLPDDILFISQEDILDSGNGMDVPYDSQVDIRSGTSSHPHALHLH